ncbi:TonB protein C-terminal [Salegentibacter holothuriorum]|uniref:TonB protein C-terminal n=1 Tax=Salegentibacter holothuriorum TaxID=241145 RepID=A0A1T5DUZ4_9FLAO|nr:energy transducer TonB [Salegentibacter holothuriorum]SKB75366.1 TonB protein C-terminal [Salegentibacter holothuriorum]
MKKLMFCFFLLIGSFAFAQNDVEVKGNTVTVKEKAPIWPGCESSEDQKKCFNQQLMKHVKNNYKYPRNAEGEFIRGKVVVKMHIDENGKTVVTSVKGDQKPVIAAVENMLKKMPEMKPGTRGGKPTKISYTLPLNL